MQRVLFVDVRNTARSPMAEAWFNHLAAGWGHAISCGTMPAREFDLNTILVMSEVHISIREPVPRPLRQQLLAQAKTIVLMGHEVRADAFPKPIVWSFPDPTGQSLDDYRMLRDLIREKVLELAHQLRPLPTENTQPLS